MRWQLPNFKNGLSRSTRLRHLAAMISLTSKARLIGLTLMLPSPLLAQAMPMDGHDMGRMAPDPAPKPAEPPAHDMADMADMPGMSHDPAAMDHAMAMPGLLGGYAMTREGSGTSWQPEATPMRGVMTHKGGWMLMSEASVTLAYDRQGGPRGDAKTFSESMAMLMASREIGGGNRLGLRAMLSLDPAMGPSGYPLLFATGETANGRDHLIDRQHPHDLFMELAASIAHDLGNGRSLSLYAGLPGEPALGPTTFMHRFSGQDNPEAPIGHHWFDSSHITFGVVTIGFSSGAWKIESSAFRGREPDQHRWNIESPKLDSWSVRTFWNPTKTLSFQLSTGHIHSPEALDPDTDEQRTTASASWALPLGDKRTFAATVAWSAKDLKPGPTLTAWLGEAAYVFGRDQVYGRVEHVRENELFESGPLHHDIFGVTKLSLGAQHEFALAKHAYFAIGGLASAYAYPQVLKADYGGRGVKSFMLYGRLRFGQ